MLRELEELPETALREPSLKRLLARVPVLLDGTARRTVFAVGDQAIVSGTRFLMTALVGRVCGPQELGNYALAFTIYSLIACAQESLVSLPFTIYGAAMRGDQQRRFAGSSLAHYAMLSLSAAIMLAVVALVLTLGGQSAGLAAVIGIMSITLPLACFIEFARRFCIARVDLSAALTIDAAMGLLQTGGMALLAATGQLSAVTAYACIALSAALAGGVWFVRFRSQFLIERSQVLFDGVRNWRFSRWLVAGQVVFLTRGAAVLWILAAMLGRDATGIYAACETIPLLANPIMLAAINLVTPQAARAFAEGGRPAVRQFVRHWTMILVIGTALMSAAFAVFGESLLLLLFGDTFAGHRAVVMILGLIVLSEGWSMAAANGLLAIDQPRVNLIAIASGSMATLGLAAAFIPWWGLVGAALASLIGRNVTSIVMVLGFARLTRVSHV